MNIKERILKALDSKRLNVFDDFDLRCELLGFIKEAFDNLGMTASEAKCENMAFKVCEYFKHYKYLTIEDVKNIFYFGSIGIFGENYRLNMQIVHKWTEEYNKERSKHFYDDREIMTAMERIVFLIKNRKKLPFFDNFMKHPVDDMKRRGLKRINEI